MDIVDVHSHEMKNNSLTELAKRSKLIELTLQLIKHALASMQLEEAVFEERESMVSIKVLPMVQADCIYVLYEDRSLQNQFEHLLTFHHQMEAVSHIAAGVAHELRNPLSVIRGFLQLAQLTNDFHKYYDTILSELNRMNGIIEDFVGFPQKKLTESCNRLYRFSIL